MFIFRSARAGLAICLNCTNVNSLHVVRSCEANCKVYRTGYIRRMADSNGSDTRPGGTPAEGKPKTAKQLEKERLKQEKQEKFERKQKQLAEAKDKTGVSCTRLASTSLPATCTPLRPLTRRLQRPPKARRNQVGNRCYPTTSPHHLERRKVGHVVYLLLTRVAQCARLASQKCTFIYAPLTRIIPNVIRRKWFLSPMSFLHCAHPAHTHTHTHGQMFCVQCPLATVQHTLRQRGTRGGRSKASSNLSMGYVCGVSRTVGCIQQWSPGIDSLFAFASSSSAVWYSTLYSVTLVCLLMLIFTHLYCSAQEYI